IGAFQTGWLLGFSILGLDREIAVSTSISHHVLTQAWGVIQGVFGVLLLLTLSGFFNKIKILTKAPFYPVQILALLIVSSFWILVSESRGGMAVNIKNSLTEICNHCVLYFDGKIKNNTTGIYSLTNGQIKEVYDTKEWFEQFPYFDQRGDRLLFSQTKSLSRFAKGRILELKNGQVNVLIENGLFPSLTRDGSIVYERDRKEVLLFKDGKETKIFPLNEESEKHIELSKPRISPSGKLLAITVNKPSKWHIWVVDLTSNKVIANFRGCEPWFWTDEKIVYIRILDGKRNINIFDLNKRKETSLITPFENYVTFYFPHAVDSLLFFGASEDKNAGAERGVFDLFVYDQNQKKLLKLVESTTLIKWPFLQPVSVNY
ncbi:MAG: hypothetical protein NZO16_08055, partial [Deltaproteobacteria bacterium]|nr:hypothetical protein [Deltaproteobacteria bacterium]